jgi:hypothetical protein
MQRGGERVADESEEDVGRGHALAGRHGAHPVERDGPDQDEHDTSVARLDPHHPLALGAAGVLPAHRGVGAGLVHRYRTRRGDGSDHPEEASETGRGAFGVAFLGDQGLSFA